MGWLRVAVGDADSAAVLFRRSLALRRDRLPAGDLQLASPLAALAELLSGTGELEERYVDEALSIRERALGPDHPDVVHTRSIQALVDRQAGRLEEAEATLRDVVAARIQSYGEEHFQVAATRNDLGLVLRDRGMLEESAEVFRQSWIGYVSAFGDDHVNPALVEANLARVLWQADRKSEAAARFAHALPIVLERFPDDPRPVVDLVRLGEARCAAGSRREGRAALEDALGRLPAADADGAASDSARAAGTDELRTRAAALLDAC